VDGSSIAWEMDAEPLIGLQKALEALKRLDETVGTMYL
jgi:hypothetical protein